MNIKNQVCTSVQGKKLADLGISTDSIYFSHCVIMPDILGEITLFEVLHKDEDPKTLVEHIAPAFTSAELSVMLGNFMPSWSFKSEEDNSIIWVTSSIEDDGIEKPDDCIKICDAFDRYGSTEAESKAKLLIDLIENEIEGYSIDEVNKRLTES